MARTPIASCSISALINTFCHEIIRVGGHSLKGRPARRPCPVVPSPNPSEAHSHLSCDRGHGHALIAQIQKVGFRRGATVHPASECHTGAVQPIRHRAVGYPKLCTNPAERPTGGIELKFPANAANHFSSRFPVQRYKRNRCQEPYRRQ